MGRYKCAYNCENSSGSDVKFFRFPLYNPRKLKKWLANMKWKDWTPNRFSVLCMDHFEEQYIDRSGKSATLREDAVPTIFTSSSDKQKKTASVIPRRKRQKTSGAKASEKESTQTSTSLLVTAKNKESEQTEVTAKNKESEQTEVTAKNKESEQTEDTAKNKESEQTEEEALRDNEPKTTEKWRVIVDERLLKIKSFPHFFHGDYCAPQSIQWAPDDDSSTGSKGSENVIEVTEPWQWLGLDVRGPLPTTLSGHRYILTVTDYYSRWVEAAPMPSCLPPQVAKNVADIVSHLGYPVRILSRLPPDVVHNINRELKDQLKDQLKVRIALVVYHPQTGTTDLMTSQLIDRMVSGLFEEHAADWDVYLPAKVFSLCFKEHPETKERPFSVLWCSGREPVWSPRELSSTNAKIQESTLVIK